VFDAAGKIVRNFGVRALWQGVFPTTLRNVPCFASYFAGFEWSVRTMSPDNILTPPLYICFLAGGIAGFSFWGIWYPLEVIKTRMQTDNTDRSKRKYKNTLDCISKTYNEEGIKSFWKGYAPSLLRAFIVNSCIFAAFSYVKRNFG